ncbi:MAG: potassium transporter TrkA [Gammaproteobacteria bacterium]|nr:potassium transporter TrkA [Gammaproteobacteria bacterium]
MDPVIALVMRRARVPLLVLLFVYFMAVLGMTFMPGEDDKGQLYYMDIFHSFYFVSYMGTTIGFGEIPYEFTGAQRMWATFTSYLTVVCWIYAIGTVISLLQDDTLRRALTERRFQRAVQKIHEQFYLICGYGDTGRALVNGLEEHSLRSVVIENKQRRINVLTTENHSEYMPKLCADAGKPEYLLAGGLKNKHCAGVVAFTDNNLANLQVAITAKLLNPKITVICRVDSHEVAANMDSFGTDYIINPFDIFASQLHTALYHPNLHLLREWLKGGRHASLSKPLSPPRSGLWVMCGYGRFGKAVYERLKNEKTIRLVFIEVATEATGHPKAECVLGLGTEAHTLQEAHIEDAVGIIAGTNDDVNNLSIVMTAREINPKLFVVIRQNLASNQAIFDAVHADLIMHASQIAADYIRVLVTVPMFVDFILLAIERGETWASSFFVNHLSGILSDTSPHLWEMTIGKETPAICELLSQNEQVELGALMRDPRNRNERLPCIPLLLQRNGRKILMPTGAEHLEKADKLLWCGVHSNFSWMDWSLRDHFVLIYVLRGETLPRSFVLQWWHRRFRKSNGARKPTSALGHGLKTLKRLLQKAIRVPVSWLWHGLRALNRLLHR